MSRTIANVGAEDMASLTPAPDARRYQSLLGGKAAGKPLRNRANAFLTARGCMVRHPGVVVSVVDGETQQTIWHEGQLTHGR